MNDITTISAFSADDHDAWLELARGYKHFYATETSAAEYATAWSRLLAQDGVFGLGARRGGQLVGIAHYLLHSSTWTRSVCYLQDLYTAPVARGQGVAAALIDAVAERARAAGATRYYWLTQDSNTAARRLYDRVAVNKGFIRYDYPLQPPG